jgi:transcriptional regulator with XRE-family HTH domain
MAVRLRPDRSILGVIGGELAGRRRFMGLSQEELAGRCDIHPTSLGRIERGEADCSILLLSHLYMNLECSGVSVESEGFLPRVPGDGVNTNGGVPGPSAPEMIRRMGQALRTRRDLSGLCLEAAATLSALHRNTLWSFEKGIVSPSAITYFRILRALDVKGVTAAAGRPVFL